jgi:hypothetical protein
VKANLARFTVALLLLATMAMSLGAGMRWSFEMVPLPWDETPVLVMEISGSTAAAPAKITGHRWG